MPKEASSDGESLAQRKRHEVVLVSRPSPGDLELFQQHLTARYEHEAQTKPRHQKNAAGQQQRKHEPLATTEQQQQQQATTIQHVDAECSAAVGSKDPCACLQPNCTELFDQWNKARQHMKECGFVGKPNMGDSRKKGVLLSGGAKVGGLSSAPREAEVVKEVKAYFAGVKNYPKGVLGHIRNLYGNVPFETLGYGSFQEFMRKHGIRFPK